MPVTRDPDHPNAEVVNDEAKLLMHRLVARTIRRDPTLMAEVAVAMDAVADRFPERTFVAEWRAILALPTDESLRLLTSRSERMTRLRLSSPFVTVPRIDLQDIDLRRRIWRTVRRLVVRQAWRDHDREPASPDGPGDAPSYRD